MIEQEESNKPYSWSDTERVTFLSGGISKAPADFTITISHNIRLHYSKGVPLPDRLDYYHPTESPEAPCVYCNELTTHWRRMCDPCRRAHQELEEGISDYAAEADGPESEDWA